jgi:hypothetical protein
MRKHRYINQRTEERTESASIALQWHRNGDTVQIDTLNPSGSLNDSTSIEGAKVETERERFDREEGRERCKHIAEELDAYADGNMYRCPECGGIVEIPETVGDKFKCYHCGETSELSNYEQLGIYDYMEDMLDIDFTVNRYKEYQSCSVCIGWGGPNIFIDTSDAYIKLYWGSTQEQYPIKYDTRDAVDEWAREYYEYL